MAADGSAPAEGSGAPVEGSGAPAEDRAREAKGEAKHEAKGAGEAGPAPGAGAPASGAPASAAGAPAPRRARLRALAVVPSAEGAAVRTGLAWVVATTAAAVAGPVPLAAWLAAVAALAAAQVWRSWRRRPRRPALPLALAGAALPLVALAGGGAVVLGAVALAGVAAALERAPFGRRPPAVPTAAAALVPGLACAAVVLVRREGLAEVLALLALVSAYDAGAYLVGTDAPTPWEGPAAGVAAVAAVALAVAAVLVPPFAGASPWVLGLVVAVGAPAGPLVATATLGGAPTRAPALRRLDSLALAGPAWALATALLFD